MHVLDGRWLCRIVDSDRGMGKDMAVGGPAGSWSCTYSTWSFPYISHLPFRLPLFFFFPLPFLLSSPLHPIHQPASFFLLSSFVFPFFLFLA